MVGPNYKYSAVVVTEDESGGPHWLIIPFPRPNIRVQLG